MTPQGHTACQLVRPQFQPFPLGVVRIRLVQGGSSGQSSGGGPGSPHCTGGPMSHSDSRAGTTGEPEAHHLVICK